MIGPVEGTYGNPGPEEIAKFIEKARKQKLHIYLSLDEQNYCLTKSIAMNIVKHPEKKGKVCILTIKLSGSHSK